MTKFSKMFLLGYLVKLADAVANKAPIKLSLPHIIALAEVGHKGSIDELTKVLDTIYNRYTAVTNSQYQPYARALYGYDAKKWPKTLEEVIRYPRHFSNASNANEIYRILTQAGGDISKLPPKYKQFSQWLASIAPQLTAYKYQAPSTMEGVPLFFISRTRKGGDIFGAEPTRYQLLETPETFRHKFYTINPEFLVAKSRSNKR